MKAEIVYMLGIVVAGFLVNYALRALPFLLFAGRDRELPKWVERFGDLVSPVIIAALIFYSYSGLQWRTPWPYLAGALVVALQVWRRNALLSILSGTILYMGLLCTGCTSTDYGDIVLDAAHPSIRYSTQGFLVGDRFIDPNRVPKLLESYDVPHDRVIHIIVDEEAERNLKPARSFMGLLAHSGYTRSVLVSKKKAESHVMSEEERMRSGVRGNPESARRAPPPRGSAAGGKKKIRYKGAND